MKPVCLETAQYPAYPKHAVPFLKSVEDGSDDSQIDIRTPLFGKRDRQDVAREWLAILERQVMQVPGLLEYELKEMGKLGPLSFRKPFKERRAGVLEYYATPTPSVSKDYLSELGYLISQVDRPHRFRPIGPQASAASIPSSTSSGLPLFRKKHAVLEESLCLAKEKAIFPAMLGWRGASGGPGLKQTKGRVVWMFPYNVNIVEGQYVNPITDYLVNKFPQFASYKSMDAVDRTISIMLQTAQSDKSVVLLSSDFSGFDQSIGHLLVWFFDMLKFMYTKASQADLDWMHEVLRTIELQATRSEKFSGSHGMPSGSKTTYIANTAINIEAQLSTDMIPNKYRDLMQGTGDDAVSLVTDVDKHISSLTSLGFNMNHEKQHISRESVMYLRRLHHVSYKIDGLSRGVYPTMRALNSLLGQERFHEDWDQYMVTLRTISILENCSWHPSFYDFIKYVATKGDAHLKANTQAILMKPQHYINRAIAIPGFLPSYNQTGRFDKGLKNFRSVRAILKL
jgi:hypothetical protein